MTGQNIKLKDRSGVAIDYSAVTKIQIPAADGNGDVIFQLPPTMQEKLVSIDSNGTTEVTPDAGYDAMTKVTVTTNVSSSGGETEEVTVDLSMADGDQVIMPSAGKSISKATVTKPSTLIPANIKKDVNIGGVIGAYEGGGTGEQAQLFAPTIALDVYQLTITNNPQNGGFLPTSYEGFVNGSSVGMIPYSGEVTTIDTSPLAETGETSAVITVTAQRNGFQDSQSSNAVNWERYYTVTFYDGDTVLKTGLVQNGVTVAAAQPSTEKVGYNFDGWYSDASFETPVAGATEIYADMTLYGKWVEPVYISALGDGFNIPYDSHAVIAVSPDGKKVAVLITSKYQISIYDKGESLTLLKTSAFGSANSYANNIYWVSNDLIVGFGNTGPSGKGILVYSVNKNGGVTDVTTEYIGSISLGRQQTGGVYGTKLLLHQYDSKVITKIETASKPFEVVGTYTQTTASYNDMVMSEDAMAYYGGRTNNMYIYNLSTGEEHSAITVSRVDNIAYTACGGGLLAAYGGNPAKIQVYDSNGNNLYSFGTYGPMCVNNDKRVISYSENKIHIWENGVESLSIDSQEVSKFFLGADYKTLFAATADNFVCYNLNYNNA